jgi:hypothetical protein
MTNKHLEFLNIFCLPAMIFLRFVIRYPETSRSFTNENKNPGENYVFSVSVHQLQNDFRDENQNPAGTN